MASIEITTLGVNAAAVGDKRLTIDQGGELVLTDQPFEHQITDAEINEDSATPSLVKGSQLLANDTFEGLSLAVAFVTAYPDKLSSLNTTSYRTSAECAALVPAIAYPDGGGADYIIASGGTGTADGVSFIDAGAKQLELIDASAVSVKKGGAIADGTTDNSAQIKATRQAFGVSDMPNGDYVDNLNGEFYLYPSNAEVSGGYIRKSVGGTTHPVTDPRSVMFIEKTIATDKGALGNFDAGGLYVQVNKKGGDALVTAITGYVRSVDGPSDTIGVHGRVALTKANNNDLTGSEGFGLWAYCDINPTGGGLVTEGVGLEIDMRNRGGNIPFNNVPLGAGSMQGDYRGLIVATADSSAGYCSHAIDVGAQSGSNGWHTGLRLRVNGIAPSSIVGEDTCQMRVQGASVTGDRYGGISFDAGNLTYGIDLSAGAIFQNDRAINVATNQKIFLDGNAGFRNISYNGTNFNLASMGLSINGIGVVGAQKPAVSADATDLATALTLINELKARLKSHGLIAS